MLGAPRAAGGPMKIAVAKEIDPSEPRVAASPDTVKKYRALGVDIAIEPGAGIKSGLPDSEFTAVGATVSADAVADAGISAFAMELMPRITRAQVMDVLSSQANLAGYRAVIEAAEAFGRAFP